MHEESRQFAVAAETAAEGKDVPVDMAAANCAAQEVELLVVGHSLGGELCHVKLALVLSQLLENNSSSESDLTYKQSIRDRGASEHLCA